VLIHAGDFSMIGERDAVLDFNFQLGELPHRHKIVIAGIIFHNLLDFL
jgi:hypothetical protein